MAATDKSAALRKRASAAAFTLLGIPAGAQAATPSAPTPGPANSSPWSMDASFMRYSEAERITVLEPQIAAHRDFSNNESLDILVTVDTITGATPLGTLPATSNTVPNTVTSPSGRGTNPIIGKIPLSHMSDTRIGIDTTWQQPLSPVYRGLIGADVSKETDYISVGATSKLARDLSNKNTTVSFGIAPEIDISNPNGGLPVAYSTLDAPDSISGTRDTKWLLSGMAGITQVINDRTIMQFNYGLTHEQGYLNDPYKLLSLINAQGDPLSAIHEKRPHQRTENSFYWLTRHTIWSHDVASLGLRYYTDDWGIISQTIDFTFRRQSNDHFYWEPHVRYYHQSAADFYHIGLMNAATLPNDASSDLRLAEFEGVTFGISFGYTLRDGSLLILRAEYYTQNGESYPKEAVGAQRGYDLFPTLNASIFQIDYHFDPSKLLTKRLGS